MKTIAKFFRRAAPDFVWGKLLPSKIARQNLGFLKHFLRHDGKSLAVATKLVAPALLLHLRTVDTGNDLFSQLADYAGLRCVGAGDTPERSDSR